MTLAFDDGLNLGAALLVLIVPFAGCQCSGDGGSSSDGGSTNSDIDTDTDSDTDTDVDSDTDTDGDSDSCPGEETDVALDPTLEWEAIPDGMECGPGCQQLTGTGGAVNFDVWGDWVVVQEHAGQPSSYITLVDMQTLMRSVIGYGYQTIEMLTYQPTVHAFTYFFVGREAPGHEYRYIWGTLEEKGHRLLEPCTGSVYELDAWEQYLAYVYRPSGEEAGAQDLHLLNLETQERKAVTDFGGVIGATISGGWITFTRLGGNVEIYAYNVITEELTNISDHPSDQFNSRNDGPRVVWTDLRSDPDADYYDLGTYGAADIWYYDIEIQDLRQITNGNGIQLNPDIHGDWIVWADYRDCSDYPLSPCSEIWGYNLATEEERKISQIYGGTPRVWGDNVYFFAYYEEDSTMSAIFIQDLAALPDPDAGPDASTDGGK